MPGVLMFISSARTMRTIFLLITAAVFLTGAGGVSAADPDTESRAGSREIIPGSELMTSPERERYRQRMRDAGSSQEQAKVRAEHVKQMHERARLRGLRLADPPYKTQP
jgi:hypothetical protein